MRAIRAHFDGRVIVPDEPLDLPPDAQVTVLIEQATDDAAAADEIRSYYQSMSAEERAEDEQWGKSIESYAKSAWT